MARQAPSLHQSQERPPLGYPIDKYGTIPCTAGMNIRALRQRMHPEQKNNSSKNTSCIEIWKQQMWPLDSYLSPWSQSHSTFLYCFVVCTWESQTLWQIRKTQARKAQVSKFKETPKIRVPPKWLRYVSNLTQNLTNCCEFPISS